MNDKIDELSEDRGNQNMTTKCNVGLDPGLNREHEGNTGEP